jgi:multicomponent Na+:H+ antiporter subunit G
MSTLRELLALAMVVAGSFFLLVGSVGILRLPDVFCRTHATTKNDTLGIMLAVGGLAVFEGFTLTSLKLVTVLVFVALAYPIGSHVLVNAAARFQFRRRPTDSPGREVKGNP